MFLKFANADLLEAQIATPGGGLLKSAHKAVFNYEPREGFLYVRSRAISNRTNDNFDTWPDDELRQAYGTFIGKPVFVNHHNDDVRRKRGVIIDAALHEDIGPDGLPDVWIEVLMEIDAIRFPKLAKAILAGDIERTSMGADVGESECSYCGNIATTPSTYCAHIKGFKGRRLARRNIDGTEEEVLVHEICRKISFFENSVLVEPPADPTAFFLGVDDRGVRQLGMEAKVVARSPQDRTAKISKDPYAELTDAQKERFAGTTVRQDSKGFYCHTHRARGKSYPSVDEIPDDEIESIESTGAKTAAGKAVRGFPCEFGLTDLGREALKIYRRMESKTATVDDLVKVMSSHWTSGEGVGNQWALEDENFEFEGWGDHGGGAYDYAWIDDSDLVKNWVASMFDGDKPTDDEIWDELEDNLGAVMVVLVGSTDAKYLNPGWDAAIPVGSTITLDEIRYNAGWGWVTLRANGRKVKAKVATATQYVMAQGGSGSHTFELHIAGCADLDSPKYVLATKDPIQADSVDAAIAQWLDDQLRNQGYSESDVKVYPCARSGVPVVRNVDPDSCPASGTSIDNPRRRLRMECPTCGKILGTGSGRWPKHKPGRGMASESSFESEVQEEMTRMSTKKKSRWRTAATITPRGACARCHEQKALVPPGAICRDCVEAINRGEPMYDDERRTASAKIAWGETKAPPQVNTLGITECPVCGTTNQFDSSGRCMTCGHLPAPEPFREPDLEVAQKADMRSGWVNPNLLSAPAFVPPADGGAGGEENDPVQKASSATEVVEGLEGDTMRPSAAVIVSQEQQIARLAAENAVLRRRAGLVRTADEENPAQPVPEPGETAPSQSTDDTRSPDTTTDVTTPGAAATDVSSMTTTEVTTPGAAATDVAPDSTTDVTSPVSGATDQRPYSETVTLVQPDASGASNGTDKTNAFAEDNSWVQQAEARAERRAFACLHLARLRIQAGIADGDDLVIAQSIKATGMSDEAVRTEITTLSNVIRAQGARQPMAAPARRQAARTAPSLASVGSPIQTLASSSGDFDTVLW